MESSTHGASSATLHDSRLLILRPAIELLAETRDEASLPHLRKIIADAVPHVRIDATTRALAARSAGRITRNKRKLDATYAPPGNLVTALSACVEDPGTPRLLRHACIRAISDAEIAGGVPALENLLDDGDALEKFAAAQALSRLTGSDRMSPAIRDAAKDLLAAELATP